MGELLSAFAFASDLAFGLEMEDCLRSCYVGVRVAERLGFSEEDRAAVYYTTLLKDAGCTCWTSAMASFLRSDEIVARRESMIFTPRDVASQLDWMRRFVAKDLKPAERLRTYLQIMLHMGDMQTEGFTSACEVSARIAARLGMPREVQQAVLNMFESWDGSGQPNKLKGEAIPPVSRLILPAFLFVPFHRVGGREAALNLARAQKGKAFDPAVSGALESLGTQASFWSDLEEAPIVDLVLSMEPDTPFAAVSEGRLDDVALAFADFIDLKSPFTAAHSRRVAAIAERIGAVMSASEADRRLFKRTALMHDLGLVAVPSFFIDKAEGLLTPSEREAVRLHPYHGERVVSRVPALAQFAGPIGAHHERFDGSGYYRGLKGKDIPQAARIVAVADRLDELTHARPDRAAATLEDALKALVSESGTAFDPDIVYAVAGSLGAAQAPKAQNAWPGGLSDREVEVLRLAARGITRRDMARALSISESTVRHHLEHIYNKTGASTRVAATLFAIENDLLP